MINSKREKVQGEAAGVAISNRVVRKGFLGKVMFEHRSEGNEGMNQWNLGNKPSRQRENKYQSLEFDGRKYGILDVRNRKETSMAKAK